MVFRNYRKEWLNDLNNNITQINSYSQHCLSIFYYIACTNLLFTLLDWKALRTIYLCDCLTQ